jgi:hypothetical protein
MSNPNSNRNLFKKVSRLSVMPVRAVYAAVIELWVNVKEVAMMLLPRFGGRPRNRDFDQAGRDSQRLKRRRATDAVFREGERERMRELVEAERESRKFAKANTEEAIHYREQLEKRKLDVSRGEIVNHLAKVNAKHRDDHSSEHQSSD